MAKNNTPRTGGLNFSIVGFLVSVIVVFLVSLIDFIPLYFLEISVIDLFFPLRFIIVASIVAGVYSKFRRGGEGVIFSFLLMLAAFMVSIFADYIIMIAWAMLTQGFTALTLGYFTFFVYLKEYYYIGPTFFFSVELSGIILLGLNILAYIVSSLVVFGTIAIGKNTKIKQQQTEIVSGEFLSRNAGADMSSPFVQARMWTERGLVSAGHKTNPIYNNQMAVQTAMPFSPPTNFAPVAPSFSPAPQVPEVLQHTAPIAAMPDFTEAAPPALDIFPAQIPSAQPEDLTKVSSASEAVREMWKNNAEEALEEEGNINE